MNALRTLGWWALCALIAGCGVLLVLLFIGEQLRVAA
jgi:hypothetical protein